MLKSTIYIVWVIFWIYWIASAFGAKKTASYRGRRQIFIRFIIFIVAVIIIKTINSNIYSGKNVKHELWLKVIGTVFFVAGLSIAIWARRHLGKNWGMPMSIRQEPELVTSGPYKSIRHPIYSGILLASIGTALAVSYFWFFVMLISGAYFIYSAVVEEKDMGSKFPKTYPTYKKSSKMLIPFIL